MTEDPGKAIDAGNHQDVAGAKKIQYRLKLGPAGGSGSAALLSTNDATSRRLECSFLNFEALAARAYTSIADDSHGSPRLSHLGLDHETTPYQKSDVNPIETHNASQPNETIE